MKLRISPPPRLPSWWCWMLRRHPAAHRRRRLSLEASRLLLEQIKDDANSTEAHGNVIFKWDFYGVEFHFRVEFCLFTIFILFSVWRQKENKACDFTLVSCCKAEIASVRNICKQNKLTKKWSCVRERRISCVLWFEQLEKVIDFVRIKSNQRSISEETALTFLTFVVVHWWDNGSHQIPPNWRQIYLFHFYGFLLGRKTCCAMLQVNDAIIDFKVTSNRWLRGNSRRANSLNSSTFQISNPNLPSHSQQIFSSVTNISSKGLNFIFCEELLQREVRNAAKMAAPPPFRKREVFMAFWDLNPLDILRQSPSITQLDHERQQQPSHRTLEPKRKREEWRLSSRHKS